MCDTWGMGACTPGTLLPFLQPSVQCLICFLLLASPGGARGVYLWLWSSVDRASPAGVTGVTQCPTHGLTQVLPGSMASLQHCSMLPSALPQVHPGLSHTQPVRLLPLALHRHLRLLQPPHCHHPTCVLDQRGTQEWRPGAG